MAFFNNKKKIPTAPAYQPADNFDKKKSVDKLVEDKAGKPTNGRWGNETEEQVEDQTEDSSKELETDEELETGEGSDTAKKLLIGGIIFIIVILIVLGLVYLQRSGRISIFKTSPPVNVNTGADVNITDSYYEGDTTTPGQTPTATTSPSNDSTGTDNTDSGAIERLPNGVEVTARLSLPVPKQSGIMTEDNIPSGAIRVVGTPSGFEPASFTVNSGADITLALTAKTDRPVVLTFYDANMAAVSIGCGPGETRWVSFKAPTSVGEYTFRNDTIGLSSQIGKMIVK